MKVARIVLSGRKDGDNFKVMPIATATLHKLKKNKRVRFTEDAYIHSEQGTHHKSPTYQKLLKKLKLGQSMSR